MKQKKVIFPRDNPGTIQRQKMVKFFLSEIQGDGRAGKLFDP